MERIELNGTDQDVFYEQLDCGLKVYVLPFPKKKNYYVLYGTKYGSINLDFELSNKMIKTNSGVAHFLEHKMFENEDGIDPFEYYSRTGTNCNASTSYKKTEYYINGINNLEDNLLYLINNVNKPYFTDENVEKEKGIIIQEIKMYDDNPNWILVEEMFKSVFVNHPVRENIAGYPDTVNKITKEELYNCYNTFYQPSNMTLLVGGNVEPNKIIELIKNDDSFSKNKVNIKNKKINEPEKVNKKFKELQCDSVSIPKLGLTIKKSIKDIKDKYKYDLYIKLILRILFGSASEFREKMYKEKKAVSLYTDSMIIGDHIILQFFSETIKPNELAEEILKQFKSDISEEELKRTIKVLLASQVMMTDNIEFTIDCLFNNIINWDDIIPDMVDILRSLNTKELNDVQNSIDIDNNSVVILKGKN